MAAVDGRVVVCGGYHHMVATAKCYGLDPRVNAWTAFPDLPEAKAGAAAAMLPDGGWLVTG